MKAKFIIFCGLILFCFSLWAQEKKEIPHPQIIKEPGKPLRATWPDGREGQLEMTDMVSQRVVIDFDIFENTCSESVQHLCQYHAGFSTVIFRWIWTKNQQNQERVGKTIEILLEENGNYYPHSSTIQKGVLNRIYGHYLSQNVPYDQLVCDSWKWLEPFLVNKKNNEQSGKSSVKIGTWSVELMEQNPETGENENRTILNIFNVNLIYDHNLKHLTLYQLGDSTSQSLSDSFLIIGDVIQWNLDSNSSQQCSLAFKPNLDQFYKKIDNINTNLSSLKSVPVLYEDEETLKAINDAGRTITEFTNYLGTPYQVR